MSRKRYLIAYDIGEPRRLRRVIKIMENYGQRLQYSVFLCDLSNLECLAWRTDIMNQIKLAEDSVIVIDLGPPGSITIEAIGLHRTLPTRGPVIV